MARPMTKKDLLTSGHEQFDKLMDLLNSFSIEELTSDFSFDIEKEKGQHWKRDKNTHDVLVHLYEWHRLMLSWVEANLNGEEKTFLREGYNWRTYGLMNEAFTLENQNSSYEEILILLKESHVRISELMATFTNDELFSKGIYPWVGNNTLGSYFVSVTSSHYDWSIKKMKKYKKSLTK